MEKIMCKKDFSHFKKGEIYDYWTNFGGLNHLVSNGYTKEEMRDLKINLIFAQ